MHNTEIIQQERMKNVLDESLMILRAYPLFPEKRIFR